MSTELVRRDENAFELGKVFAESGMFPNTKKASEAIVKIIAGREFGLGPMAAMNGIHMVDGKPTLAANLIAGQIKRHPRYDYRVLKREADGCWLEFFQDGETCSRDHEGNPAPGTPSMKFEKADAERAGLLGKQNWRKYPRDMYFARCLTAGARTYCPDVLGGSPIYTAEELGADERQTTGTPLADLHTGVTAEAAESQRQATERAAEEVKDAEVVDAEPAPKTIGDDVLAQLREAYVQSGLSRDELCWFLLSVGVESLPESPTSEDVGNAMRSLTLEQALKVDALIKGEDDGTAGSGEAS